MSTPLLRGSEAPSPRTLVDILRATIETNPDSPAVDNGTSVLTYGEFADAASDVADTLQAAGVERGDRVGIRIPSGTLDLYVAIAGILVAGAAYVPVDFDDPDERAQIVFGEADVAAIITTDLVVRAVGEQSALGDDTAYAAQDSRPREDPTTDDDAWIIFTSGSTGKPKGVAVTHRNAAAFVDAESRMFLQESPIGPGDRVMAGLSVAFDASCEEMWLAWRYGACLVPAPRSLVRSGVELGPWLTANRITVVSTVPTLVALWPTEALSDVRLLILGGEACPPEIGARLANESREVWNTYGPTEATVVACGAQLTGEPPMRIGLPLAGWDLAVVDATGGPVPEGESGELIIGGVGLARYLDEAKDKAAYAAMPALGWERAYRSGDLVRNDPAGLVFLGRADDQVKVGGRRIELGEIDSALLKLPGVSGAAAAVRKSEAGNTLLIGYVTTDDGFDARAATESMRQSMPAALVPRLAVVDTLPTRTSGKIDRDALPWPLTPTAPVAGADASDTAGWVSGLWASILGGPPSTPDEDFFDVGGGSLSAAQLVSRLRERFPEVTVADIYEHSSLGSLAAALDEMETPTGRLNRDVPPVPAKTQAAQLLASFALRSISGLRWITWIGLGNAVARSAFDHTWLPSVPWWWLALGWLLLISPVGRMALAALGVRILLRDLEPGEYPRGGAVHLRVWLAERLVDELGAANVSGAPFIKVFARALGATVADDVDLHSVPPVTGMLDLGAGVSIEPEVDLRGHWIDGAKFIVGPIRVREGARVGARSSLLPGADVGERAEIAPGSAVFGIVPAGESWSGAPAEPSGTARGPWHDHIAANRPAWLMAYAVSAVLVSLLPIVAIAVGATVAVPALRGSTSVSDALGSALLWVPLGATIGFVALAAMMLVLVRLLAIGLHAGAHPVHGRQAWQAWSTIRILDDARTWLFPLYSSSLTPAWLRALGADLGPDVEASTVLLIPKFTRVGAGAFLADDTMIAGYELGAGWLRVEDVRIGKHAFVGNSGMAAPGRKVPKQGLVAVLSAAPRRKKAKAGTSWLGSPPRPLRREGSDTESSRTYAPPTQLRVARAVVEALRAVPVWIHVALVVVVVAAIEVLLAQGLIWAVLLSGLVLLAAGAFAAGSATAAKWLLVGQLRPGNHPLWSSFVWRNELADTFVEVLAAPWFARAATGTLALNLWLRSMGARIGDGVWCETYWLPEADLVRLDDGASINAGTVVQTHLFHDRVLSMDTVTVKRGGTLGPNSVILPAAQIGRHATVGPVSLVMRGESVPDRTRWIGNPVGPWVDE
ncbi:Pls/PosA family non-ribosomal peptide synthetase [Knoellia sp. S7-12]|uniref:Pls/PosA family non-ribosomal peptide synthetase n=1 Tax=Knoellia sp. S7-12 TaxID=3126698 RepID=UPI0033679E96